MNSHRRYYRHNGGCFDKIFDDIRGWIYELNEDHGEIGYKGKEFYRDVGIPY
jgi:hypothetical protein